jgi:hypothetical protein
MQSLYGKIDSLVYAGEIACPSTRKFVSHGSEVRCNLLDVPFECPFRDCNAFCKIPQLRRIIGDHTEQHDIKIPMDNTQADRKRLR